MSRSRRSTEASTKEEAPPEVLRKLPEDRVVDVDVRDDLRSGREPFGRIMAARERLPEGGVLRVRAIFEPGPLYGVMARHGLTHWTETLARDDWRIWFFDPLLLEGEEPAPGPEGSGAPGSEPDDDADAPEDRPWAGGADGSDDVVVLDVRGLEPPQPLVRTLEALDELPAGAMLVHLNVREPVHLFPRLEERGARWEVARQEGGPVRVFIRKAPE